MLSEPERLTFDVPGQAPLPRTHRLICWQWGKPDAKNTILCVHGLTRNGRDFDFLADVLAQDFRVLCPDMPGRGISQYLSDATAYNYATYMGDIAWMLTHLNIERVHWIGTSMGGIIALMFAQTFPGKITSLTLNDVGCLIPAAGLKRIFSYAGAKTSFETHAEAEQALRRNCASFGIPDEIHWQHLFAHSLRAGADGKTRFAYDPAIAAAFPKPDAVEDVNLWPWWEAVKSIPVLVIRGANSDILPLEIAQQMQQTHPNLMLHEVAGAGHAPSLMTDKEIALIRQWISAIQ